MPAADGCERADLENAVDELASATDFSGVVRVDDAEGVRLAKAYGLANRAHWVTNTADTRFAVASVAKGLTALAVVGLVVDGLLQLTTPARSVLGDDLPLIDDAVTVEHLLAHRSGIGDYMDEDVGYDITHYVLGVSAHELATTESYLRVLDGHPQKFAPGERFAYCNSGYVVLALIAERVSGVAFAELVRRRVCEPAGMPRTEYLRSDELPADTATGYLAADGLRTNVFHLPVRGSGDGGIYSTAADLHAFWSALFAGHIVSQEWVATMTRPHSAVPEQSLRYGLGFWLHDARDIVMLQGFDAGVSARTVHDPHSGITHTVLSNNATGAWSISRRLDEMLLRD